MSLIIYDIEVAKRDFKVICSWKFISISSDLYHAEFVFRAINFLPGVC